MTLEARSMSPRIRRTRRLPARHLVLETAVRQSLPSIATSLKAVDSKNLLALRRVEWKKRTQPA